MSQRRYEYQPTSPTFSVTPANEEMVGKFLDTYVNWLAHRDAQEKQAEERRRWTERADREAAQRRLIEERRNRIEQKKADEFVKQIEREVQSRARPSAATATATAVRQKTVKRSLPIDLEEERPLKTRRLESKTVPSSASASHETSAIVEVLYDDAWYEAELIQPINVQTDTGTIRWIHAPDIADTPDYPLSLVRPRTDGPINSSGQVIPRRLIRTQRAARKSSTTVVPK